jgi:hypothetical protein
MRVAKKPMAVKKLGLPFSEDFAKGLVEPRIELMAYSVSNHFRIIVKTPSPWEG